MEPCIICGKGHDPDRESCVEFREKALLTRIEELEREHRNLRMLVAAIVDDANGEMVVPHSVLVSAGEGTLSVEYGGTWDSNVVLRTDARRLRF